MTDVTHNLQHFYPPQSGELDGSAWWAVVEIDDSSVKDQRKIVSPVSYSFLVFRKKNSSHFSIFFLPSFPE